MNRVKLAKRNRQRAKKNMVKALTFLYLYSEELYESPKMDSFREFGCLVGTYEVAYISSYQQAPKQCPSPPRNDQFTRNVNGFY